MPFFVSRQNYWPDGEMIVEVAEGGLDYSGADMLVPKWRALGEGQEYTDPREAVDAAIQIRDVWRASSGNPEIEIGVGCTMGFTLPFEPATDEYAKTWAEKKYEALEKCVQCGELIGKERYTHDLNFDREGFCSSNCSENNYLFCLGEDEREAEEEYWAGRSEKV